MPLAMCFEGRNGIALEVVEFNLVLYQAVVERALVELRDNRGTHVSGLNNAPCRTLYQILAPPPHKLISQRDSAATSRGSVRA